MTANTIIKNIIKRETEEFISKHNKTNFYLFDSETKLTLEKSEKKDDTINFNIETTVNYVNYKISGYITEFGYVSFYMIEYKVYDPKLEYFKSKFIYSKELENFKF